MNLTIVDADSLVFIIAHNFKEEQDFALPVVQQSVDSFISSMLTLTKADRYVGVFSARKNFRYEIYKYQPYKGKRPPRNEAMIQWEQAIKSHLTTRWGFYTSFELEADDIIIGMATTDTTHEKIVICTPDKDLRQIPGIFFDHRLNQGRLEQVSEVQAMKNFWAQVLTGCQSDNVAGVPGLGEVKVRKLFADVEESEQLSNINLSQAVRAQYLKYYGPHYGPEIYYQTLQTVMLVQPGHPRWSIHKAEIRQAEGFIRDTPPEVTDLDEAILENLGWTW